MRLKHLKNRKNRQKTLLRAAFGVCVICAFMSAVGGIGGMSGLSEIAFADEMSSEIAAPKSRKHSVPSLTAETFVAENRALLPAEHDPRIRLSANAKASSDKNSRAVSSPPTRKREVDPAPQTTKPKPSYVEINTAPLASIPENLIIAVGEVAEVAVVAQDLDNDPLTCRWRQIGGASISYKILPNYNLSLIAPRDGVYIFECVANDGKSDSDPAICAITAVTDEF